MPRPEQVLQGQAGHLRKQRVEVIEELKQTAEREKTATRRQLPIRSGAGERGRNR